MANCHRIAILLACSAATPCLAQTKPIDPNPGTTAATADPGTPANNAQDASPIGQSGVADIIVTAQRRSENLQHTALAISAVSSEQLAKANITDVTGLTKLVPSLIVQPATGTSVGFYLRGVGSLVGNAFTENPVAFNFNNVYIARPAALLGTFYDLQRVEVLKGPQGTLYGRNATGGAINVIPNRPELNKRGLDLSLETGNYRSIHAQAAVNLPISDTLAVRVAGQLVSRRGYLSDGTDDEVGQAARASILYEPSASTSALIVADFFHQGGVGPGGVLVPGALTPNAPPPSARIGGADPRSIAALRTAFPALINSGAVTGPQNDAFVNSNFYGISAELTHDFGFAKLTVIPAFRESKPNYLSYSGGYYARVNEDAKQTTLEARLSSPGSGRFNYVIGGYFFGENQHSLNNFNQGPINNTLFDARLKDRSYAVFGQATLTIVPAFRLVGGGRYTWEDKNNATILTQTQFGVGPTTPIAGQLSFKKFTYKAGFEWDVAPRNLIYGNVSTGFKSGGFFIAAFENTFRPENITAYTVGSKNRFFDNILQFNIEVFYWKYRDQQVNYIGPGRTSANTIGAILTTTNAGKSRIYGAEADLVFKPAPSDTFAATVQYLNGQYTDFRYTAFSPTGAVPRTNCAVTPNTTLVLNTGRAYNIDCSGKPQINSPRWSFNLSYEHQFLLGGDYSITPGARSKIESSRYLSPEYLPEERQGHYTQSDLYVTLANSASRYSVTGFVDNIENSTVYAGTSLRGIISVNYNILRAPRTYGVRASFSF